MNSPRFSFVAPERSVAMVSATAVVSVANRVGGTKRKEGILRRMVDTT